MTVQKEITCHQSGVTCIDYAKGYIFTGGEDGNICVLKNGEVVNMVEKAHNAQVSGISVVAFGGGGHGEIGNSGNFGNIGNIGNNDNMVNPEFLIISTSLDQRVNGFLMKNGEIKHVFCYKTAVSDLTGFDTVVIGSEILVALAGQGLELISLDFSDKTCEIIDNSMVDSI